MVGGGAPLAALNWPSPKVSRYEARPSESGSSVPAVLKLTFSPATPGLGEADSAATGGALATLMMTGSVEANPAVSVTVSFAVYTPAAVYVWGTGHDRGHDPVVSRLPSPY